MVCNAGLDTSAARAEHFTCRINLQEQIGENWFPLCTISLRGKGGADKEREGIRISERQKEEKDKDKQG